MAFGLISIVVVVAVIAFLTSRGRGSTGALERSIGDLSTSDDAPSQQPARSRAGGVSDELERWVGAGLISPETSAEILAYESVRAPVPTPSLRRPRTSRVPAAAEALGYLGGILAVVGLGLLVGRNWSSLPIYARLLLSAGLAVVLLVGGAMVHAQSDAAFARLRGFLWLASAAATGLFAADAVYDGFGISKPATIVLAGAGLVTLHSGLLWMGRNRPLQHLTALVALAATAGAAIGETSSGGSIGLLVWLVGVSYLVVGLQRLLSSSLLTEAVGSIAVIVGSVIVMANWTAFGSLLAPVTGVALLALALVPRLVQGSGDRRLFLVMGIAALLASGPSAVGYYAHDGGLITGVAVWLFGVACVYMGAKKMILLAPLDEVAGGVLMIIGAAVTSVQFEGVGPAFGIANALILVALGTIPGQVVLSFLGAVGLLANVPWLILHFFPGEGRAPLLILISGALILAIALVLARERGRFRSELGVFFHRH